MLVCGDIHGKFKSLIDYIKTYDIRDENILFCGDFGLGFDTPKKDIAIIRYMNYSCKSRNIHFYIVRGNHDNPSFWLSPTHNLSSKNVHLVPDNTVLNIEGKNVLFLGGSVSVDRVDRIMDHNWWRDEVFVLDEELLKSLRDIDIVVSHTAPLFCFPQTINIFVQEQIYKDNQLWYDINKERKDLEKAYNILKENNTLLYWLYGHFHMYKKENIDDTTFILNESNVINQLYL